VADEELESRDPKACEELEWRHPKAPRPTTILRLHTPDNQPIGRT